MNAERVDPAEALGLDQVALDAWHYGPDVAKWDAGEAETPKQCDGDTKDGRENTVTPVLGDGKGSVAGFPHSIHAVCAIGLSDHILKLNLKNSA